MYKLIQSLLFLLSPERAHYFTMRVLGIAAAVSPVRNMLKKKYRGTDKPVNIAGITFPNRIGMAAGFDKNAAFISELSMLGFGHIEVGTVTPKAQPGNDKPRLFRLKKDKALINRMGFNNHGMEAMAKKLHDARQKNNDVIIGVNIGKNKVTPNEKAIDDYILCFRYLYPYADYFTVNVSSPNTPGLRELQDKKPLTEILDALMDIRKHFVAKGEYLKPIFLKIAPDLENAQLDDIVALVRETRIEGVVCTNTTISREGLQTEKAELDKIGAGGLSGVPVRKRSTEVIRYIAAKSHKEFAIIGVGGINSAADAREKLEAGADLLQVYTGFIYEGPGMVREINRSLWNPQ